MPMRNLKWFGLVAAIALVVHVALVFLTPYAIMAGLNLSLGINPGYGKLLISEPAVHGKDKVVRSSPDLLYSICAFKMSQGPLRISVPPIDSYMSVSFFAHNTDNLFSINDQQAPKGIDVVLAKPGEVKSIPEGSMLLETNTPYGVILLRYYLGASQAEEFDEIRNLATCEPYLSS
jgi:uncharacterized membrane protein